MKALLKNDYTVIVPTRSEYKSERLKQYTSDIKTGELIPVIGSVNNEENAEKLRKYLIHEFKTIDMVVASLGGWQQGYTIQSYPVADWDRILKDNLTSHFLAIKTLIPLLNQQGGSYVHINGFSADEPYPMAGPVAMTAAAQKSLMQTLAKEMSGTGIRVYELILGPVRTRDRLKHGHGQIDWYFPEEIGEYIIKILSQEKQTEVVHYLLSKNR